MAEVQKAKAEMKLSSEATMFFIALAKKMHAASRNRGLLGQLYNSGIAKFMDEARRLASENPGYGQEVSAFLLAQTKDFRQFYNSLLPASISGFAKAHERGVPQELAGGNP